MDWRENIHETKTAWWFQPYPSEKYESVGMMTFHSQDDGKVIIQPIIQPCSSHHQPEYHVISNLNISPFLSNIVVVNIVVVIYTPTKFFRCGPQEVNSAPWNHQPANQLHQFPLSFPFDQSMESWPSPSNTPTWARLWPAPTQHSAGGLEILWNGWIPDLSWSKYPLVSCHITMERSTMLLMGKSTISTGPFSIANC